MGRNHYQILNDQYAYFYTATVMGWQPVFTRQESVQILLDSFVWLQTHTNFRLHTYVILENHLHFIATSEQHSQRIQQFKSYTARRILDLLQERKATTLLQKFTYYKLRDKKQSDYQFWQEGTHPEEMSNETVLTQLLGYIHFNPVKRGYVDLPEHWRYSSAHDYMGLEGLVPIVVLI